MTAKKQKVSAAPAKKEPQPLSPRILKAIEAAAERAAKRGTRRAVREVLLQLGLSTETEAGMLENQRDAAFVRRFRVAAESKPAKFGLAAFSALLMMIGGLIVALFRYSLDKIGVPHG